ncbi:MAG: triose-phosphate isomerase [Peptococcaceae bacterium]|nr:triose-phosphate isomerase [Peptococcaceae bacterium]
MRTPVIAGNWKMNKTATEAVSFCLELRDRVADIDRVDILVCPPFTALKPVADVLDGSRVMVGAQNMYAADEGAYTGEVSPRMLLDAGCSFVILGHSERRQYFGETDRMVNEKVRVALRYGLKPIVCVGESLEQREKGTTTTVVGEQVRNALSGVAAEEAAGLVIAYEPVWAIGTGRTASPKDAQEVNAFIREVVAGLLGASFAGKVCILYGGSVKPDNARDLMSQPDIDGALVGGASLDINSFIGIITATQEVLKT